MNEIINYSNHLQTKMEKALQPDENGMVSAKRMYELLGLDPSHYARWCENNILKNDMVTEGIDFRPFAIGANAGGQATTDYMISLSLAESLCMMTRTPNAKEVRNYFVSLEPSIKNAVEIINKQQEMIVSLQRDLIEFKNDFNNRLTCIESGTSVSGGKLSEWVKTTSSDIMELSKYCDCSVKEMYSRVIQRMEEIYGIFFQRYFDEYAANHSNEKPIWRITVIEYYDLKDAFEDVYIQIGKEVGLYQNYPYES